VRGWTASVWVHNLTNSFYWISVDSAGDGLVRFTGPPRIFGVSLGYKF
jgi:outer membrane receptor protein involved in Fe transport